MAVLLAPRFAHPDDNKIGGFPPVLDVHQLAWIPEALDTVNPCAPTTDVPSIGSLGKWIPFGIRAKHFHQETYLASPFSSLTDGKISREESSVCTRHDIIVRSDCCWYSFISPASDLGNEPSSNAKGLGRIAAVRMSALRRSSGLAHVGQARLSEWRWTVS